MCWLQWWCTVWGFEFLVLLKFWAVLLFLVIVGGSNLWGYHLTRKFQLWRFAGSVTFALDPVTMAVNGLAFVIFICFLYCYLLRGCISHHRPCTWQIDQQAAITKENLHMPDADLTSFLSPEVLRVGRRAKEEQPSSTSTRPDTLNLPSQSGWSWSATFIFERWSWSGCTQYSLANCTHDPLEQEMEKLDNRSGVIHLLEQGIAKLFLDLQRGMNGIGLNFWDQMTLPHLCRHHDLPAALVVPTLGEIKTFPGAAHNELSTQASIL